MLTCVRQNMLPSIQRPCMLYQPLHLHLSATHQSCQFTVSLKTDHRKKCRWFQTSPFSPCLLCTSWLPFLATWHSMTTCSQTSFTSIRVKMTFLSWQCGWLSLLLWSSQCRCYFSRFVHLYLNWLRKQSLIYVVISWLPAYSWLLSTCWWSSYPPWRIFGVVGVTSANMLIFILPSSLYLKITHQDGDKGTQRIWAALFLGLGVVFSLVSIPLVIYDWACSSSGDEGHWDPPRKRNSPVVYSVKSPHISNLSL